MDQNELLADLKKLRAILNLSQLELAQKLGVTQATVSRIESKKQSLTDEIAKKILQLVKKEVSKNKQFVSQNVEINIADFNRIEFEESSGDLEKRWNYYFATNKDFKENSDLIVIKNVNKFQKAPFLFGDMTGHGRDSAYMSFGIRFAFESMMGMFSQSVITTELINAFLGLGILRTKQFWKESPSLITGLISIEKNQIELTNQGMPYPIYFSEKGCSFIKHQRYPAIDINKGISNNVTPSIITIAEGDSIIICTDGLFDVIPEDEIAKYIENTLSYFRGDSKAIGKNILRFITKNNRKIKDDISFLILSVKEE